MSRQFQYLLCLGSICWLLLTVCQADGISIKQDGASKTITTPHYTATVAEDGSLTNLRLGETEFIGSDVSRGLYFYQDGLVALPDVKQASENIITAACEKAATQYEFLSDSINLTLSNHTEKNMEYVFVLASAIQAMSDEDGLFHKTPLSLRLAESAWFIDTAKLQVVGTTHIWPWVSNHQVMITDVKAGETVTVTLKLGQATKDEMQKAAVEIARKIEPPKDPEGPMWDLEKLGITPAYEPAEGFEEEGVQAIYINGPDFEGRPTKIFVWLGLPKVEPGEKVPAMVLVHGGGGTAFAEWVRLWTSRGYAAIAMDTCGCVPKGTYGNWERNPEGGPAGWGGFDQIDNLREDQWTYHAVASAILSHSLIRSLPEVDPERVGLTGISWGGYLTCIIAGADNRFKFAVPVYGCGFTLDMSFADSVKSLGDERGDRWMRWWDPSAYLPKAEMPILWVTGSNDFAYTLNALQMSYRLPEPPHTLCIRLRMPHGHGGAGENPEEIHAFANTFCKNGEPLALFTGQGLVENRAWATFESTTPIVKAELNFTCDTGSWPERNWDAIEAKLDVTGHITAELPAGTKVYYFNITDNRDLVVSTEHVEVNN